MNLCFGISFLAEDVSHCGIKAESCLSQPLTDDLTTEEEGQKQLAIASQLTK